jgi:GntR family transcriptional regulator
MTINSFQEEIDKAHFDPHSPIPLYHQVYLFLRKMIVSGILKPGEMMPPEMLLVDSLQVGRQTIRQALSTLVTEGLVERFSGKGTFVRDSQPKRDFYLDRSFSQEMAELGRKTHSKVLLQELGFVDESAPESLHKKLGAPCLFLTRLRYGDGMPIGYQQAIVLTEYCPGLEKFDFANDSLYRILSEMFKLEISEIYHIVNAVNATKELARLLNVEIGSPILLENSVTFLANSDPIEATSSYFRADQHRYSARIKYMGSKKSG